MTNKRTIEKWVSHPIFAYLLAAGSVLLCVILSFHLAHSQSYHLVAFILLLLVSFLSTFLSTGPILLASTLSAITWNFFFIPPSKTFHIERTDDLLIFVLFFAIAVINGIFTSRVRMQKELVRQRENRTNALLELTKALSGAGTLEDILKVATFQIDSQFQRAHLFLLKDQDGNPNIPELPHHTGETELVDWVLKHNTRAGRHTPHFPESAYTYFPLFGNKIKPGILRLEQPKAFDEDQAQLWEAFLVQIGNALERESLNLLAQKAKFLDESDRLYKTLFNSISHEFRIPVATIMGASDTLLNGQYSPPMQSELFHEILTASVRLNRLIENLLNMSRLESGQLALRPDWHDINDLFNRVSSELKTELENHRVNILIAEFMPLVRMDFGLMEQVIYILLLNATQYTPKGTTIDLEATHSNNQMILKVHDYGPGFARKDLRYVFDKFFRIKNSKTGGLGLGLSIVKGFIEAHGGAIVLENHQKGGACFTITLPSENPNMENMPANDDETFGAVQPSNTNKT
jgi:two-component system sensor histidine kinase KdpD